MKTSCFTYIKLALSFLAILTALDSHAQEPKKESTSTMPGEIARATWSIDASKKSTYLSTKEITTPRWFHITETGPDLSSSVELIVDGKTTNYPINYEGSALVWGKTILAKNYSGQKGHLGEWMILDATELQKTNVSWSIFPETNREAVAGAFDTKREFILSFSQDKLAGDCTGARIKPIVDEKPIPDEDGKDLYLYPSGSIIAFGKNIRLSADGTCKPGTSLTGSIKLL